MLFLYILAIIIAIVVILALAAPKTFTIDRSTVINKPRKEVFTYLMSVKNQDHWSPWKKKDPDMKQEYEGEDGTVGFIARWEGNKDVGMGEQEITKITAYERIDTQLRFFKPWKSESDAFLTTEDVGTRETKVTWGFSGKNKFPFSIFFLFFNMDKTVGKDFEEGLTSLKTVLEQ